MIELVLLRAAASRLCTKWYRGMTAWLWYCCAWQGSFDLRRNTKTPQGQRNLCERFWNSWWKRTCICERQFLMALRGSLPRGSRWPCWLFSLAFHVSWSWFASNCVGSCCGHQHIVSQSLKAQPGAWNSFWTAYCIVLSRCCSAYSERSSYPRSLFLAAWVTAASRYYYVQ